MTLIIQNTITINVPSHIKSEFGKCKKDILGNMEPIVRNRIGEDIWQEVRKIVLSNLNSIERNVGLCLNETKKRDTGQSIR